MALFLPIDGMLPPGCYGVPEKSDDEEDARSDLSDEITTPWFCDSCRAGMHQLVQLHL